jgi:hypothetical protein
LYETKIYLTETEGFSCDFWIFLSCTSLVLLPHQGKHSYGNLWHLKHLLVFNQVV